MFEFLNDSVTLTAMTALLGLFVGSFLNVVIHRLPKMMELEWQAQAAELRGETSPNGSASTSPHPDRVALIAGIRSPQWKTFRWSVFYSCEALPTLQGPDRYPLSGN